MKFDIPQKILVTHPLFSGDITANELDALGFKVTERDRLNLTIRGTLIDTIRLNMMLRSAHRVLYHLFTFRAAGLDDLYKEIKRFDWENIIPEKGYFSIHSHCQQPGIRDYRLVNLKAKDAIADHFVSRKGSRPDSGNTFDQLVLFIYWADNECAIYIDTSGNSIAKHGYRLHGWKAPLSEALAAAIVLSTRWDRRSPFINPMCGSGTLVIEATLIATNRYPGTYRQNYGFRYIRGFRESDYNEIRSMLEKGTRVRGIPRFTATDIHAGALRQAKMNAEKAGVDQFIHFSHSEFKETPIEGDKGIVILNPEYGERMGEVEFLKDTYRDIGNFFKSECQGFTGYVFTGNPELAKSVGLRTRRKIPFMNGKIECRLLEYELYSGTRKK